MTVLTAPFSVAEDRQSEPEPEPEPEPMAPAPESDEDDRPQQQTAKRRRKLVTKTFVDEEGFMGELGRSWVGALGRY